MSVVDVIKHYQRSIEKCSDDGQRMLHCLHKLFRLPVTVQHLKETGIGRTVNALRHHDGEVGDAAKTTVLKWKAMVAAEESSDGEGAGSPAEQVEEVRQNTRQDTEERLKDKSKSSKNKDDRSRSERHREEKRKDSKHKTESHNHKPETSVDQRKYDKHKVSKESQKHDHKPEKEKSSKESYSSSSSRKQKDVCKSEDKHSSSRHSHKRKHKDSSSDRRKEDKKRKKRELERSSDEEGKPEEDSDSKEMQINEQMYDEEYEPTTTYRTQEQNEESGSSNSSDVEGYSKENRSRNSSSNYSNGSSYKRHISEQNHDVPRKHQKHKERSSGEERVHKSESDEKTNSSSSSSKTNSYKQKEKGADCKDHKHSKSDTQKIEVKKEKTDHVEKNKLKHEKTKTNEINHNPKKSKEKGASTENASKEKSTKKVKLEPLDDEGISSHSGASFAEALGMVDPIVKKRSSGANSVSKTPRSSSGKSIVTHDNTDIKTKEPSNKLPKPAPFELEEPPLLAPSIKLEPLDVDLDSTLPEINPNYKPLPYINPDLFPRRSKLSDEEALSRVMSTKNQRTKVYSGVKSNKSWATTPSLFDICVRVLQENIDALEYTGGVPYDLLKPVLNHATPEQLLILEHYNPYLVEDTDELWEFHCKKRFRTKVREDMETWREMFMRCSDEQEARLKALTTNISQTMKKSTPVRQTKLAYVEGVVKPPRNVAKQQAKYGTARMSSSKTSPGKGPKQSASSSATTSVPPPPRAVPTAKVKHRMAPLMQKTMKLAKSFKR